MKKKLLSLAIMLLTLLILALTRAPASCAEEPAAEVHTAIIAVTASYHHLDGAGLTSYSYSYVEVDGSTFTDLIYSVDSVVMAPLSALAERFGWEVKTEDTGQIRVQNQQEDIDLVLIPGSTTMLNNTAAQTLRQAPTVQHSELIVPVREVCEAFGLHVYWRRNFSAPTYSSDFIWVSEIELLDRDQDMTPNTVNYVLVEEDANDGYEKPSEAYDTTYSLRGNGVTSRGIRLNDSLEQVLAAYGSPTKAMYVDGDLILIEYASFAYPDGAPSILMFYFVEDIVVSVEILGMF